MIYGVAAFALVQAATASGIPETVVAAAYVKDCIAAVKPGGTDLSLLQERGWSSMNLRGSSGVALPVASFARASDMTIVMASTAVAAAPSCTLMVPTNGKPRADALQNALSETLGGAPTQTASMSIWRAKGHRVTASSMSSPANPMGLKIEVILEN